MTMNLDQSSAKAQCKILVIEDDADIRETLRQALEYEGYDSVGAANGQEGLEILGNIDSPCLILLDLMMPVMDGWKFAEKLRDDEKLSTIPVVIVSAFVDQTRTLNAQGILKKPVELDALLEVVKKYCG